MQQQGIFQKTIIGIDRGIFNEKNKIVRPAQHEKAWLNGVKLHKYALYFD